MILPTKHLSIQKCLLGAGAKVLEELKTPTTISALWDKVRFFAEVQTFEKYILLLSMLYTLDTIDFSEGLLRRT